MCGRFPPSARPTPPFGRRPTSGYFPARCAVPAPRSAPGRRDPLGSAASTVRTIRPGTPITSERGGTCIPSGITAPAATTLPRPDPHVVEQHAAHADEALVLDRAAVEDHPVADADPAARRCTESPRPRARWSHPGGWSAAPITIGAMSPADHRAVPDARLRVQRHVAHDGGRRRDEGGRMDAARSLAARAGTASGSRPRRASRP